MPTTAKPLLIVDNDLGLLRQLRWAFSDHRVYAAGARQEAIDLVRREAIPVAIVDLGLPPIRTDPPKAWPPSPRSLPSHQRQKSLSLQVTRRANMLCEPSRWAPMTFTKNPSISMS